MNMQLKRFCALMLAGLLTTGPAFGQDVRNVAITAIVQHPALDAVRDGVIAKLTDAGFGPDKVRVDYTTAEGQPAIAAQIARQLVGASPDVIVAIGTPSAQAVATATKEIPLIFSAVTDPVASAIVPHMEQPGGNVTGISDLSPLKEQLDLMISVVPSLKKLGVIYNTGESNSVSLVAKLEEQARQRGIEVFEAVATKSADVQTAARSLVGKVDAIYLPTDNTVVSAAETAIGVAQAEKIPLFAGDTSTVERGALGTVGFSYYEIGLETGQMVVDVLNGKAPGTIDARVATGSDMVLNLKAAKAMGFDLPADLVAKATKVID